VIELQPSCAEATTLMTFYVSVWVALTVLMLMLVTYRKRKARAEEDVLRVSGAMQDVLAVVTVLYGLVLLVLYFDGVLQQAQELLDS
jgi:hypothetical protein